MQYVRGKLRKLMEGPGELKSLFKVAKLKGGRSRIHTRCFKHEACAFSKNVIQITLKTVVPA